MEHPIPWNDKLLGFGFMRLPHDGELFDLPLSCDLIDRFLAHGFTYFDTAYGYPGSEVSLRETLVKRYPRDAYQIADKMTGWFLSDTLSPQQMFEEQLERCGVDYFDFYLLHSLQPSHMPTYEKYDTWNFCRRMKEAGKIRHFGFSFHGAPDLLDKLLTEHPEVDFVQLQLNYVDWDNPAIHAGGNYAVCRKHHKDIVVMEPVKAGFLANLKPELLEHFRALDPDASAASYALRFVGSLPGVRVILSGMNTAEQMEDNIATFERFVPLSEQEQAAVRAVTAGFLTAPTVPCTNCRYCAPGCPKAINIPEIFNSYNMYLTFGPHSRPHSYYKAQLDLGSGRAADCIGCGQCESVCPQHIPITEWLGKASDLLDAVP